MGFLKFCCIKLLKTLIGALIVLGAILGYALLSKQAPWVDWVLICAVIVYIFLRCWWEDYEKEQRYKQNLKRK